MSRGLPVKALFLDVGGVLLTNGWDHVMRGRAADVFRLDYDQLDERHGLTFDIYETGKISLDTYLDQVVFHEPRSFSKEQFRQFMFEQSQAHPDMIALARSIGERYGLKVGVISNEGRELAMHRTHRFALDGFVQVFVYSSFVQFRKPDEDIYRVALDISQTPAEQAVYIEDRAMFADVASGLGMRAIHHTSYEATRLALEQVGLRYP